jgi:formylglycine-generating enzyme required for sulfatase activity/dienelactone hydrolase
MIGRTLSHYEILERLGGGGMGVVYRARDTRLDRPVAIKLLREVASDGGSESWRLRQRFVQEAKAASALDHPNIGTIHQIDETEDGRTFIVMACYDGESLGERIGVGPLAIGEVVEIGAGIAAGLGKAHETGIVHRDIKPANVMVTADGLVKIIDFGLAILEEQTRLTAAGTAVGTMAYMAPEQVRAEAVTAACDVWAFGVVLYQMLTGRLPFGADNPGAVVRRILDAKPTPVEELRPDTPMELAGIVRRALAKDPSARPTAREVGEVLAALHSVSAAETAVIPAVLREPRTRPRAALAVGILTVLAVVVVAGWLLRQQMRRSWARTDGLAQVERLRDEGQTVEAFDLATELERTLPGDAELLELLETVSERVSLTSRPEGAEVSFRAYSDLEGDWRSLGRTPLEKLRLPAGLVRWRFEKAGYDTQILAVPTLFASDFTPTLIPAGETPVGMVPVPGGRAFALLAGLDPFRGAQLEPYLIDEYEVTNRQYQEFVDADGYADPEYWLDALVEGGDGLSFEQAMARFRDATGRPGPATWELSRYPTGGADYPVHGVSWYEAAAYARFAGKSLPTIFHWVHAAGTEISTELAPLSRLASDGPAPVGASLGISIAAAYDMAGNVREWCWNESGQGRYILGGAWDDQDYIFRNAFVRSPLDRSPGNGFRCVRYSGDAAPTAEAERVVPLLSRDYRGEAPIPDDVYEIYRESFSYDATPLNARIEASDASSPDWTREKVTFDAAYGSERVTVYLFLPKSARPPYQTVVYYPPTTAILRQSFDSPQNERGQQFYEFLIRQGRAFAFPILAATYERGEGLESTWPNETHGYKELTTRWVKDYRRTIDYLETRGDIDPERLAYFGYSWGARFGAIIPAVEPRLRASVLLSGGLVAARARPEVDQFTYVSRVTTPTLMINGLDDTTHPVEFSQKPMMDLLGTPAADKRHILYEGGHIPPRHSFIRETLDWLDTYLGPVESPSP